jgi:hypothetical protein
LRFDLRIKAHSERLELWKLPQLCDTAVWAVQKKIKYGLVGIAADGASSCDGVTKRITRILYRLLAFKRSICQAPILMPGNPIIVHAIYIQVNRLDENYSPCYTKLDIPCCCPALKLPTLGESIPKKPSLIDIPSLRLFH